MRELILVTPGLDLAGGGRAALARLLATAGARFAAARGLGFRVLSLEDAVPPGTWGTVETCGGSPAALVRRLVYLQLRRPPPALVFDLLGPARAQMLLPRRWRSPYLVFLLGIEAWRPLDRLRARAVRGAQGLLAISRATRDGARSFLPPRPGEIPVLPLALEDRPLEGAVDEAVAAAAGEGYLLMVGRMAPDERYKGHDAVLAALAAVAAERPATRLVIAGEGRDRPRLEALAAELRVAPRTLFTGFVSEATLRVLYERCRALVLPSRGEGFGLVYLEAMRAARPVIACEGTAAAELVEDRVHGLLVPVGDDAALAVALARMLDEPDEARRMGEEGRRRFTSRYRLDAFCERLAPHLEALIAAPAEAR